MSAQVLDAEIRALALVASGFIRRPGVSPADEVHYQRRKAETLTVIACEDGDVESREVASLAWRRVRELQERL